MKKLMIKAAATFAIAAAAVTVGGAVSADNTESTAGGNWPYQFTINGGNWPY